MNAKQAAANHALQWIQNDMIVGLGSGSTAANFIIFLGAAVHKGLRIQGVATSHAAAQLATQHAIPLIGMNDISHIDITVDGADEIDPEKRMIKGRGGAHVREKIVASASRELIVIIDESKLVPCLGKGILPVEVIPFGAPVTRYKMEQLGYHGTWRLSTDHSFLITDNGNFLFDIQLKEPTPHPEKDHEQLRQIPGVVDTGFFFGLAGRVIIGTANGTIQILH